MTKPSEFALIVFAVCVSSCLGFTYGAGAAKQSKYTVIGRVYCDTCRVEFETKISEPISGAIVNLECKNRTNDVSTFKSPDISTSSTGEYKIEVTGDYEDSDCDVNLVKSPREDCNEPTEAWRKARVVLTAADGVSGDARYANNLGFKKKEAVPQCKQILTEMGYYELKGELGTEVAP
ncbi:hypothetical protein like AT4G08685 [Hibiscus trionum]|uniref:Uncharacterized protein n=1 Tax=Hibiscus trionum TaxID=183268 RepID=A0A9W7GPX9_HIBTR|nr:hypothetical protein like AT4G08685 [Hibiscus trionum]